MWWNNSDYRQYAKRFWHLQTYDVVYKNNNKHYPFIKDIVCFAENEI